MKKRVFFLFAAFVGIYMIVAWHFATAELASVSENPEPLGKKATTEVVVRR